MHGVPKLSEIPIKIYNQESDQLQCVLQTHNYFRGADSKNYFTINFKYIYRMQNLSYALAKID